MKITTFLLLLLTAIAENAIAQQKTLDAKVNSYSDQIEQKVIAWRRDFHEHPELSNRETRTAAIIAKFLDSLGLEVKTGIAKTVSLYIIPVTV